ncbi:YebC/PmpR family DNA-binding transcriptional regulator [Blattabacterium cuenoti]|uniref:YebC/PmpR family DNA-binding transcriptional regulator n=1 Tax=Blattabacterium cuenoti TaxID=1653831 RepID=UPI00163BF360|nr:YebC/PmpR family DNA-binding transcriptional regulator [Blattabacterium cuenoti]
MSGHSKWANIQHKKSNKDYKKSKKFSKYIREIGTIIKEYGINNSHFRNAIINAKSINIPKKTIEKTIKKALQKQKENYYNLNLEGKIYGISIIIECITDNNIRTTSTIKTYFNKSGGKLCNNGYLIHLFKKIGLFSIRKNYISQSIDDFELMSIDFGSKELIIKDETVYIHTDIEHFGLMKKNLDRLNINYVCETKCIPKQKKLLLGKKKEIVTSLINKLESYEEVKNVYYDMIK